MKILISVKGASGKKPRISQISFEYPEGPMRVRDFLEETVRSCVRRFNERKEAGEVLRLFSREALEDMAAGGKVSFGDSLSDKKADGKKAADAALKAFEDGLIALFADGKRYEDLEEILPVREGSQVTFVRLTFLAGRMW